MGGRLREGKKDHKGQKYRLYGNMPYRFNLNTYLLLWPLMASGDSLPQLEGDCA